MTERKRAAVAGNGEMRTGEWHFQVTEKSRDAMPKIADTLNYSSFHNLNRM